MEGVDVNKARAEANKRDDAVRKMKSALETNELPQIEVAVVCYGYCSHLPSGEYWRGTEGRCAKMATQGSTAASNRAPGNTALKAQFVWEIDEC